jgi:cytochrome o ubiquinol oxidase operon protein cyoD
LRYFLPMNFTTTPRENLLATAFTAVRIFLMIGGSVRVVLDLHMRMAV